MNILDKLLTPLVTRIVISDIRRNGPITRELMLQLRDRWPFLSMRPSNQRHQ